VDPGVKNMWPCKIGLVIWYKSNSFSLKRQLWSGDLIGFFFCARGVIDGRIFCLIELRI
jgi:hypothetical protein